MSTTVEQIKERLNIVDVVGQYVKLTKAGKNYKGLSPFKKEKTPSFYVSPDRGMYYCFSTGKGGDAFTFVEEMEGLDFRGALKVLAERAGVELREEPKAARDERERMYMALQDATEFFEKNLEKHQEAQTYLASRGLEQHMTRAFRLGFAMSDWNTLHDHLRKKGYTDRELERVGLIKRGEKGRYYDRFRSRIIFPISDSAGRVVAFSGRIFGEGAKDKENAKYLNSPETPLFDKSRILYGYDRAKNAIRKYNFAIIVEGQMDLLMSHQAGYSNAVAASGTGLTAHHLEQLSRISPNVVMAFDADSAGIHSASRAATLAIGMGMEVKVVALPRGHDPADVIKEDPDLWRKAIREAKLIVDFSLQIIEAETKGSRERMVRVRSETLPFIVHMPNRMDQAFFVGKIAQWLDMKEEPIWEEVTKLAAQNTQHDPREPTQVVTKKRELRTRREYLERLLVGLFLFAQESNAAAMRDHIAIEYARITERVLQERVQAYEHEGAALMFEVELAFSEGREEKIEDLLREFEYEWLAHHIEDLSRQLKTAEVGGQEEQSAQLLNLIKEKSTHKDMLGRKA